MGVVRGGVQVGSLKCLRINNKLIINNEGVV